MNEPSDLAVMFPSDGLETNQMPASAMGKPTIFGISGNPMEIELKAAGRPAPPAAAVGATKGGEARRNNHWPLPQELRTSTEQDNNSVSGLSTKAGEQIGLTFPKVTYFKFTFCST